MPVTCLPSSLPLSSPSSPSPPPQPPPLPPILEWEGSEPEREDGGEEYLYMEAPEYLYMPPLYLRMEELDEQDEAESLCIKELNEQNEAEYLGLEPWVTWGTWHFGNVEELEHEQNSSAPSLSLPFANVGGISDQQADSVTNRQNLSQLLVRLGITFHLIRPSPTWGYQ